MARIVGAAALALCALVRRQKLERALAGAVCVGLGSVLTKHCLREVAALTFTLGGVAVALRAWQTL
ncbi:MULTISPECIES: hypothetical protein [unclassified Bradyrhizobium]|uniref:hypothetical protein n=1 Tax=unclassified Bradyrhizobium TaxID=2631580 RepID=UPI002FF3B359